MGIFGLSASVLHFLWPALDCEASHQKSIMKVTVSAIIACALLALSSASFYNSYPLIGYGKGIAYGGLGGFGGFGLGSGIGVGVAKVAAAPVAAVAAPVAPV